MQLNFLILTKKELLQLAASFILGVIVGSCLLNIWVGRELDQLIYEKKELIGKINNQQTKLNKLQTSLKEQKRTVVQELEIKIATEDLDKHLRQELKEKIFDLLNSIIGRNISEIDGQVLAENLDDRVIIIEQNNYQLDLNWLLIQPTTIVEFEISPEEQD